MAGWVHWSRLTGSWDWQASPMNFDIRVSCFALLCFIFLKISWECWAQDAKNISKQWAPSTQSSLLCVTFAYADVLMNSVSLELISRPSCWCSVFFSQLFTYFPFIWKSRETRNNHRDILFHLTFQCVTMRLCLNTYKGRYSIHWLTLQMPTISRTGPGQSQALKAWVAGT